jgi:hypothetical protein
MNPEAPDEHAEEYIYLQDVIYPATTGEYETTLSFEKTYSKFPIGYIKKFEKRHYVTFFRQIRLSSKHLKLIDRRLEYLDRHEPTI